MWGDVWGVIYTLHVHSEFTRQELVLIKMIIFWVFLKNTNPIQKLISSSWVLKCTHRGWVTKKFETEIFLLTFSCRVLISAHSKTLASHLGFHIHSSVTPPPTLPSSFPVFHTQGGTPHFCLKANCCVLHLQPWARLPGVMLELIKLKGHCIDTDQVSGELAEKKGIQGRQTHSLLFAGLNCTEHLLFRKISSGVSI